MTPSARGAFVVFEGVDRCGKTTQSTKLVEYLKSKRLEAELWRFPDRVNTVTGPLINSYLSKQAELPPKAVHLLFSANRAEKEPEMIQKLNDGVSLVVDRYAFSGAAYTSAKELPGLTLDWCKEKDRGLPAPDLVIYLHMPSSLASNREGFGEERYENVEFQKKVKQYFAQLQDSSWCLIDASQTIDEIHQQIVAKVDEMLARCSTGLQLQRLWQSTEEQPEAAEATRPACDEEPVSKKQRTVQQQAEVLRAVENLPVSPAPGKADVGKAASGTEHRRQELGSIENV